MNGLSTGSNSETKAAAVNFLFTAINLSLKKISVKKIILTLFIACIAQLSFSQTDSTPAVYLRFPTIPQFTIYNAADSSVFTRENLKKRTPTVFIVFNPECEHCQHETKALIANIDKFKHAQVVMVSYLDYDQMVKFYREYKIADYPVITMGRDAKYFLPVFFDVKTLPAIFVYDKKGKIKKAFEGSVPIEKLIEEL